MLSFGRLTFANLWYNLISPVSDLGSRLYKGRAKRPDITIRAEPTHLVSAGILGQGITLMEFMI